MLCNATCDTQYWEHRVTSSIRCPLKMDVNKMFDHLIQLQRKPEPKELDISYGKKAKDVGCRVKTAKEEWKEREAPTTQTVPTRIKIFEGGSVKILAIITLVISADSKHSGYIRMSAQPLSSACALFTVTHWNAASVSQVQVQRRLRVRQRSRTGEVHL